MLDRIFSRIGASRPQSVAITGLPGMGKSSLLWFIAQKETQSKYLEDPEKFYLINMPLRYTSLTSVEDFYRDMCQRLGNQLTLAEALGNRESPQFQLGRLLEIITSDRGKVIVLFDDFHLLAEDDHIPPHFYDFLRSLANRYNIAYITTSRSSLQRICCDGQDRQSAFFNIFSNIILKPMEREEAELWLNTVFRSERPALLPEIPWLLKQTGLFPGLIQTACQIAVQPPLPGQIPPVFERDLFLADFLRATLPFMSELWTFLPPGTQDILEDIALAKRITPDQAYLVQDLIRHHFVVREGKELSVFSESFASYLASEHSISRAVPLHPLMGRMRGWLKCSG